MRGWRLFSIAGIDIEINYSWLLVLGLVAVAMVLQMEQVGPRLPAWQPRVAGLIATLLLFASVLFHELAHSLAARWYGVRVARITLFVFGGVAQTKSEAPTATAEMVIAALGPLSSVMLAGVLLGLGLLLRPLPANPLFRAMAHQVGLINLYLAVFNLLPAFPLDGGRLLRAALWAWWGDLLRSTRFATNLGRFFGYVLMGLGVFYALTSGWLNGIWFLGLGWLLSGAATQAYQAMRLREHLRWTPVYQAMRPLQTAIAPSLSLWEAVHHYLAPGRLEAMPVAEGGILVGLLTAEGIRKQPEASWPYLQVGQVMRPLDMEAMVISRTADLGAALERMGGEEVRELLVVDEEGALVGVLTQSDLVAALQAPGRR